MFTLKITDIDLRIPEPNFQSAIQDCIDNYSESMEYTVKEMSTKRGKNMYKITIDNLNNSNIEIVAEKDDVSGDMCFHPLKLQNMNESFYSIHLDNSDISGQPEDPGIFLCEALTDICLQRKGSFAYIDASGYSTIIKDGNKKKVASVALIDNDGNVYSTANAKSIKGASDSADFTVKKPIGEWLGENPDVQRAIAKLSLTDKMNYIGKYLINAKLKEEIDSDEFMDIFCQAGIFGFSEPFVLKIYKLIM